jgi:hypothetical protein
MRPLIPMFVFIVTPNGRFIDLDNAAKLFNVLHKRHADFMAHAPSGFVGTKAHIAHDLQCARALLAGEHQMRDLEPVAERLVRVLKNRASDVREAIAGIWRALVALPGPGAIGEFVGLFRPAAGAADAFRPAPRDEVGAAGFFVGKECLKFSVRELVNRLGSLGHWCLPDDRRFVPWAA